MATGDSARPDRTAAAKLGLVEALTDRDSGRWQITTEASIYVLDLNRRLLTRYPGAGPHADGQSFGVTGLSIDHQPVVLAELVLCQLGYGLYALTDPAPSHDANAPATVHRSISTPILEIRRLNQSLAGPAGDERSAQPGLHDQPSEHHDREP